jgi:acyl-homoserine-lactone acylase
MHTSSQVDAADSYIEKLTKKNGKWYCEYNNKQIPVIEKKVRLMGSSLGDGHGPRTFTILYTQHGPIMAKRNGQYLSVRADNRLMNGLIQCWQRTKAKSFSDFKKTLDLLGNISNNTVYADAEGNIAYWHGNRIPIRDPKLDWSKPVDGSISATEWKGYHKVDETVHLVNPVNGWLQNCNSTPFTVAGNNSPRKNDYPSYMAPDGENFRGINAVRVLNEEKHYTIDKVIKAGYDTRLTAFEILVPALIRAYETSSPGDSLNAILREPVNTLKNWDYRCGENSVATTLAVTWGTYVQMLMRRHPQLDPNLDQVERTKKFAEIASGNDLLQTFYRAVKTLKEDNGTWQVAWGDINRYQRIAPDIDNKFDDNKPSLPVGFVSSQWGMLPSFTSSYFQGTKKRYGYNGNSFICAVEFGKRIKAKSLLTGGESGNPDSKHFTDQGLMYSKGKFKDVLFYKEDVLKHAEKTYHPGE